ncbi:transmembrane protein 218-like isoform X1 [Belonocnema kinseyi]|uniref:transmembrane protein 218-like isoform X1 n=2 Tax=Belonocnema kinseyi TaxID=2817044 RepID=UPI00143DAF94|nr:transmembrane protein 218-like isoform X1 [Belonocnema kinseyi]
MCWIFIKSNEENCLMLHFIHCLQLRSIVHRHNVMTTFVLGIGVGLFVITCLWFFAALIFLISLRINKKFGFAVIALSGIITIILISVPRAYESSKLFEDKPYDHLFIWRLILLILLTASSLVGLIGYVKFELTETVQTVRITSWVFNK